MNGSKINTVGVKETSRLISRIRNRQFGVLITTSAVASDAYKEVRKDGHPIIFISGIDIVKILIDRDINTVEKTKYYLENNFKHIKAI
jgi:restriction endonuclease Mrr